MRVNLANRYAISEKLFDIQFMQLCFEKILNRARRRFNEMLSEL